MESINVFIQFIMRFSQLILFGIGIKLGIKGVESIQDGFVASDAQVKEKEVNSGSRVVILAGAVIFVAITIVPLLFSQVENQVGNIEMNDFNLILDKYSWFIPYLIPVGILLILFMILAYMKVQDIFSALKIKRKSRKESDRK